MSKRRERTPYQKQRDAFIKRVKRYNESHGTHFKYDFPTYQELKDANVSDERINEIADLMKEVRNEALVEQFEQGGAFAELYEHRVSSTEGALYNKGTGKLGAKLMDTYSLDKGGQTYPVDPLTGELITTKTELFLSRLGFSDYETPDDTYEIVNGRANGQYDPQKSDKEIQREIQEVEDAYPTYDESDAIWRDEMGYDEDYWPDNMSISDILRQEQEYEEFEKRQESDLNHELNPDYKKPKMSYTDIMKKLYGEDYEPPEISKEEAARNYAEQTKGSIEAIIELYHGPNFVVTNARSHQGYYVNDDQTIEKLKKILEQSFNENTKTPEAAYKWANYMDAQAGHIADLIDYAIECYEDVRYQTNLNNIAMLLNYGIRLSEDDAMDLGSEIDLGEDYDEWESDE